MHTCYTRLKVMCGRNVTSVFVLKSTVSAAGFTKCSPASSVDADTDPKMTTFKIGRNGCETFKMTVWR